MGRTGRLWSQGQGDAPTYTNNCRPDWYYDAEGNAINTPPTKTHGYDAAGKQTHFYEETWTDPTGNWVFYQNTIDQVYSGDGLPGRRVETRHSENSQNQITNDVKTVYFLVKPKMGSGLRFLRFFAKANLLHGASISMYRATQNKCANFLRRLMVDAVHISK